MLVDLLLVVRDQFDLLVVAFYQLLHRDRVVQTLVTHRIIALVLFIQSVESHYFLIFLVHLGLQLNLAPLEIEAVVLLDVVLLPVDEDL